MVQTSVRNRLAALRAGRGVGAAELARRVGVSRQTIYAIEAGDYVPNTEVALKLARELEVPVEELFSLEAERPGAAQPLASEILSAIPPSPGQAVRVCRLDDHVVSIPVSASPYFLPEADGVIAKLGRGAHRAELLVFAPEERYDKRLVLAGCDPAIGLLARMAERLGGVEIVAAAASSKLALAWLKAGKVHIAGTHLKDARTGEYNLPIVRREFPDEDFAVVTFARWEEGLATAAGNPNGIRTVADVAGGKLRLVNREPGSGARALLDGLLQKSGIPASRVAGYERIAYGHLAAAYAVSAGEADCCVATRSAARAFGLDFTPLESERYDFVMRRRALEIPAVRAFLDVLQKASLRRKLEVLAGYDTAQTGMVLV